MTDKKITKKTLESLAEIAKLDLRYCKQEMILDTINSLIDSIDQYKLQNPTISQYRHNAKDLKDIEMKGKVIIKSDFIKKTANKMTPNNLVKY